MMKGILWRKPSQVEQARQQGFKQGQWHAIENYSAAVLMCLWDKFDFTPDDLESAVREINEIFDSINEGYLSLDDIHTTMYLETGLKFTVKGGESHKQVEQQIPSTR